jgi:hypothetical protein
VEAKLIAGTTASFTPIFTVPTALKPKYSVSVIGLTSGAAHKQFYLNEFGVFIIGPSTGIVAGNTIWFNFSYNINS